MTKYLKLLITLLLIFSASSFCYFFNQKIGNDIILQENKWFCGTESAYSETFNIGRTIYKSQCGACHFSDATELNFFLKYNTVLQFENYIQDETSMDKSNLILSKPSEHLDFEMEHKYRHLTKEDICYIIEYLENRF